MHFYHVSAPWTFWTLRLFLKAKLVGSYERGGSEGAARLWLLKEKTVQSLAPTVAEASLVNRLCGHYAADAEPGSAQGAVTVENVLDFFGLPAGLLNFGDLAADPARAAVLPDGYRLVEAAPPGSPCIPNPQLRKPMHFAFREFVLARTAR